MVHTAVLLKNTTPYPWRPFDMRSHWNFKEKEVDTVFVFSNSKEVELFQNGKSLGRKKVDPNENKAIYTVTYKKGELVSKAYDGIEVIATHTLKTAQKPFKLGLTNQRPSANKEQLLFLTLEVQDKKGICVPYADNDITIKVEGGELIGLDSGDPFSHELFKQNHRKTYEGKLLVTIRPLNKDKVKVTCFADGLKQTELTISDY
jgi:beta-galactosidase